MLWNYCKNVIELLLLYQNHKSLGSWATSFKSRCSIKNIYISHSISVKVRDQNMKNKRMGNNDKREIEEREKITWAIWSACLYTEVSAITSFIFSTSWVLCNFFRKRFHFTTSTACLTPPTMANYSKQEIFFFFFAFFSFSFPNE